MFDVVIASSHFFFSSRIRHTSWNCDWSSDVCSSDLSSAAALRGLVEPGRDRLGVGEVGPGAGPRPHVGQPGRGWFRLGAGAGPALRAGGTPELRSEERRVGKECKSRWSPDDEKKQQD